MKLSVLFFLISISALTVLGQKNFVISSDSVGGVRLGMTVSQARKVLAKCKLERSGDGDGAILISVNCGGKELLTLASDEDESTTINERAKIDFIEVWDKRFRTLDGIHKGMLISEAERRLGNVKQIVLSEIESREFITFRKKRRGIVYRMYGGIYGPGKNRTNRYDRGSRLWSIQVSRY